MPRSPFDVVSSQIERILDNEGLDDVRAVAAVADTLAHHGWTLDEFDEAVHPQVRFRRPKLKNPTKAKVHMGLYREKKLVQACASSDPSWVAKLTRNPAEVTCALCRRHYLPTGAAADQLADDLAKAIARLVATHGAKAVQDTLNQPTYEWVAYDRPKVKHMPGTIRDPQGYFRRLNGPV